MESVTGELNNTGLNYTPLNYTPLRIIYQKPRKSHRLTVIFISVLVISMSLNVYFVADYLGKRSFQAAGSENVYAAINETEEIVPQEVTQEPSPTPSPTISRLKETIAEQLQNHKGIYAVAVKNLKTGESYYLNEHQSFQPASLYKLWVMATVYEKIRDGELGEDEMLEDTVQGLNQKFGIASEEAELKEGSIKLSVKDALEKMITISDNYASYLLVARVKSASVQSFVMSHGATGSSFNHPIKTTPSDIIFFFDKLYKGELTDQTHTTKMIDLLKRQRLNTVIPKYLPGGVTSAHKTGTLGRFAHDAGLVYGPKGDYIIAILSETNSTTAAKDVMAKVSEAVYKYFEN